jgi:hypothetical protein
MRCTVSRINKISSSSTYIERLEGVKTTLIVGSFLARPLPQT